MALACRALGYEYLAMTDHSGGALTMVNGLTAERARAQWAEIDEVRAEFAAGADAERLADEIGDVLFVCVNLARHARVDVSRALRHANAKFERRFRRMEALAAEQGGSLQGKPLDEQDALWDRAKAEERGG